MDNSTKVFLGFMTGLFAGVVAGVLLAPDKGDKTRRLLTDKALEQLNPSFEKAKEFSKSVGESLSETFNEYSQKFLKKNAKATEVSDDKE